jgi:hypothetical protein
LLNYSSVAAQETDLAFPTLPASRNAKQSLHSL